jgi:hypothetical protein
MKTVIKQKQKKKAAAMKVPEVIKKMDKEAVRRQRKMPTAFGIGVG